MKKTKRSHKKLNNSLIGIYEHQFNDDYDDEKEITINGKKYPTEVFEKIKKKKSFSE